MSNNDTNGGKSNGCIDHTNPEELRRLYWDEGLSTNEIAKRSDVKHGSTIYKWMKRHDIPLRDRSEAVRKSKPNRATYDMDCNGYQRWRSTIHGEQDSVMVHRLLAVSEYGYYAVYDKEIHHKNGIPWDNRPKNIEVLDSSEHRKKHNRGEKSHYSKLTSDEVAEIRMLLKRGKSQYEVADMFNVDRTTIGMIDRGETWKHI